MVPSYYKKKGYLTKNMFVDEINIETLKNLLFEVYSAGFEAGYTQENDIAKAFKQYWEETIKRLFQMED